MDSEKPRTPKKKKKFTPIKNSSVVQRKMDKKWVFCVTLCAFLSSTLLSVLSSQALADLGFAMAAAILILFILVGILFDILGIAVASAEEKPFHSMAAKGVRGAKRAVWLIRNAEKVSSVCNDVVGDIVGVVSGMTAGVLATFLALNFQNLNNNLVNFILTGVVAALTIGGKAMGKSLAINKSNTIVYVAALVLSIFPER